MELKKIRKGVLLLILFFLLSPLVMHAAGAINEKLTVSSAINFNEQFMIGGQIATNKSDYEKATEEEFENFAGFTLDSLKDNQILLHSNALYSVEQGLATSNKLVDLNNDFHIKFDIDPRKPVSLDNPISFNGWTILLEPISNIGYFGTKANVAGVEGHQNAFYYSFKFGDASPWPPGVHTGITTSDGQVPSSDNFVELPGYVDTTKKHVPMTIDMKYSASTKSITSQVLCLDSSKCTVGSAISDPTVQDISSVYGTTGMVLLNIQTAFEDKDMTDSLNSENIVVTETNTDEPVWQPIYVPTFSESDTGTPDTTGVVNIGEEISESIDLKNYATSSGYGASPRDMDFSNLEIAYDSPLGSTGIISEVPEITSGTVSPGASKTLSTSSHIANADELLLDPNLDLKENDLITFGFALDLTYNKGTSNEIVLPYSTDKTEGLSVPDYAESLSLNKTEMSTKINEEMTPQEILNLSEPTLVDEGLVGISSSDLLDLSKDKRLTVDTSEVVFTKAGVYPVYVKYHSVNGNDIEKTINFEVLDVKPFTLSETVDDNKGNKNGLADVNEELTYTIKIDNSVSPSRQLELDLVDELTDTNLDLTTFSNLEITSEKGNTEVSGVEDLDLSDGLQLNFDKIGANDVVTITFDISTTPTFGDSKKLKLEATSIKNMISAKSFDIPTPIQAEAEIPINLEGSELTYGIGLIDSTIGEDDIADPSDKLTYEVDLKNTGKVDFSNSKINLVPDSKDTTSIISNLQVLDNSDGESLEEGVDYTVVDGSNIVINEMVVGSDLSIYFDLNTVANFEDISKIENILTIDCHEISTPLTTTTKTPKNLDPVSGKDANISVSDNEIFLSDAPKSMDELLTLMNPIAIDYDGTNISDKIKVDPETTYDSSSIALDEYDIYFTVAGTSGKLVFDQAKLKIVDDTTNTNQGKMIGNEPIILKKNDGTIIEEIKDLINPIILQNTNGITVGSDNSSITLLNDGGYDNTKSNVYLITYQGNYLESNVEQIFPVIVTDDGILPEDAYNANITTTSDDFTIEQDSNWDDIISTGASVHIYDKTGEIMQEVPKVSYSNVDSSKSGDYQVVYSYEDDFYNVRASKKVNVHVSSEKLKAPKIMANDVQLTISEASDITSDDELLKAISAEAIDYDGNDISGQIKVEYNDNFYTNTHSVDDIYNIVISVVNSKEYVASTSVKVELIDDTSKKDELNIVANAPIAVPTGVSLYDLNTLINPNAVIVDDGVQLTPIKLAESDITETNYDSGTIGKYLVEYSYYDVITGLNSKQVVEVNVTDDGKVPIGEYSASITTINDTINIPVNSDWDPILTPAATVHINDSTDEVLQTVPSILFSDVDATHPGNYTVTYYYEDDTTYNVETSKELLVNVVDETKKIPVLSANDVQLTLDQAKAINTDSDLLSAIDARAFDYDGTEITSSVTLGNNGGFFVDDFKVGNEYHLIENVMNSSMISVAQYSTITIVDDGVVDTVSIHTNTPTTVAIGTTLETVNEKVAPKVLETSGGIDIEPIFLDESSIEMTNYDSTTSGKYFIRYNYTSLTSGLKAQKIVLVNVTPDGSNPTGTYSGLITTSSNEFNIQKDSDWDDINTPAAKVHIYNGSNEVEQDIPSVIFSDVDVTTPADYKVLYSYSNSINSVETSHEIIVHVIDEEKAPLLIADDIFLTSTEANNIKNDAQLLLALNPVAYDYDYTDISSQIKVGDNAGFYISTHVSGDVETVVLNVINSSGFLATKDVKINIIDDSEPKKATFIRANTPVVAANGTTIDEINDIVNPIGYSISNGVVTGTKELTKNEIVETNFDSSKVGNYYLKYEYDDSSTGLSAQKVVVVNTTDSGEIPTGSYTADITTADNEITIPLNSLWDPIKIPNTVARIYDETGEIVQSVPTVLFDNVDTKTSGDYEVDYYYEETTLYNVSASKKLVVHVSEDNSSTPSIMSNDVELSVTNANAIATDQDLINVVGASAIDYDGSDISENIEIGYNDNFYTSDHIVGSEFDVILSIVNSSGNIATTTSNIKIVDDSALENNIIITSTSPIVVTSGKSLDEITSLAEPTVNQTILGVTQSPVVLSSSSIKSTNYDSDKKGVYYVEYEYTSTVTNLKAEKNVKVIVTDDGLIPSGYNNASITTVNNEITVKKDSVWDDIKTPSATVHIYDETGEIGQQLPDVDYSNVDTTSVGDYIVKYHYVDSTKYNVEANHQIQVHVVADEGKTPTISANDIELKVSEADSITTDAQLLNVMDASALDYDMTDLSETIIIGNNDGFYLNPHTAGNNYNIILNVTNTAGFTVTTEAKISIIDDSAEKSSVDIESNNPIIVPINTDYNEVLDLVAAVAIENNAGVVSEPIKLGASNVVETTYNSSSAGTYILKYSYTSSSLGMSKQKIVTVYVTDDGLPPAGKYSANITTNSNELNIGINTSWDDVMSTGAVAHIYNSTGEIAQFTPQVKYSDVDITKEGDYTVSYSYEEHDLYNVEAEKQIQVHVSSDVSKLPILSANDIQLTVDEADSIIDDEQLKTALNAIAFNYDGTDISEEIIVASNDSFYLSTHIEGNKYTIVLSSKNSDGYVVTIPAIVEIVANTTLENSVKITGNTPIVVSEGTSIDDVTTLINPTMNETVDGVAQTPIFLDSSDIVQTNYDESVAGKYFIKYDAVGLKTSMHVQKVVSVIVSEDGNIPSGEYIAQINTVSDELSIKKDSLWDNIVTPAATVKILDSTGVVKTDLPTVIYSNVDTSKVGDYEVLYNYVDNELYHVETEKRIVVHVTKDTLQNPLISSNDIQLTLSQAMALTDDKSILDAIGASAYDYDGANISDKIKIEYYDGFDSSKVTPSNEYEFIISVTNNLGNTASSSSKLSVLSDADLINSVIINAQTPIVVAKNTSIEEVNNFIDPVVLEIDDSVNSLPIKLTDADIIETNYNSAEEGTYSLKYVYTSTVNGLSAQKIVKVSITDDGSIPEDEYTANISSISDNITVKKDSVWDPIVMPGISAHIFDSAGEVYQTAPNVVLDNVDTSVVGDYTVAYNYSEDDKYNVEASKVIQVHVSEENKAPKIVANDIELSVDEADSIKTNAELLETIHPKALDYDGTDITLLTKLTYVDNFFMDTHIAGNEYNVILSVQNSLGYVSSTVAKIKIMANDSPKDSLNIFVNTPVAVPLATSLEDVTNLANPSTNEVVAGTAVPSIKLTSADISYSSYDNANIGTYYVVYSYKSSDSGLSANEIVKVYVTNDGTLPDGEYIANISVSNDDFNVGLNSRWDDINTPGAVVHILDKSGEVDQEVPTVVSSNVDTTIEGDYQVVYHYQEDVKYNVIADKKINVHVVDDEEKRPILIANDIQLTVEEANNIVNDEQLLDVINAQAIDYDGTDITSDITVGNNNGYYTDIHELGNEYSIILNVINKNGFLESQDIKITIIASDSMKDSLSITSNNPISVKVGTSIEEVADTVDAMAVDCVDGVIQEPVKLDSDNIVQTNYNSSEEGKYLMKYQYISSETGLMSSKFIFVNETEDGENPLDEYSSNITTISSDMSVVVDTEWDDLRTPNAKAKIYLGSDIILESQPVVVYSNVDITKVGDYEVDYSYKENELYNVETSKKINVHVVEDTKHAPIISADNIELTVSEADDIKDENELKDKLNIEAIDFDGTDLTEKVVITYMDDFLSSAHKVGDEFLVELSLTNDSEYTTTSKVTIDIIDDGSIKPSLKIIANEPIIVSSGTSLNDVNKLVSPIIIETIDDIKNTSKLSIEDIENTNYDDKKSGTYYIKYDYVSKDTDLGVQKIVHVISLDDGELPTKVYNANISTIEDEITIPESSSWDPIKTPSAITHVYSDGYEIGTDSPKVVYDDVNTSMSGTYKVVYYYYNDVYNIEATKNIVVNVVSKNDNIPTINASDVELTIDEAGTLKNDSDIIAAINPRATDYNGTDISKSIKVGNSDGIYDSDIYAGDNFTISLYVINSDGVLATKDVTIKIIGNEENKDTIEILTNTPIIVEKGSAIEKINDSSDPIAIDTIAGVESDTLNLGLENIEDTNYDMGKTGSYYITYEYTSPISGLSTDKTVTIYSTQDAVAPVTSEYAVINTISDDIKISTSDIWDDIKTPVASVKIIDSKGIVDVTKPKVVYSDVNTSIPGNYNVVYHYFDEEKNIEATKKITVQVVDESEAKKAILSVNNAEIKLKEANEIETDEQLIKVLGAQAIDYNGDDISSSIKIGYDGKFFLNTHEIGDVYNITLYVINSSGFTTSVTTTIKITENNGPIDNMDMYSINPVTVPVDSSTNEINTLIHPIVVETVNDEELAPIYLTEENVVATNLNIHLPGKYYVEYSYTSTQTDLTGEKLVDVYVEDTPVDGIYTSSINTLADSFKIPINSEWDPITIPSAVANVFDGENIVASEIPNVVEDNVDTSAAGRYKVLYSYKNEEYGIESLKEIDVEVVDTGSSFDKDTLLTISAKTSSNTDYVSLNDNITYTIVLDNTKSSYLYHSLTLEENFSDKNLSMSNLTNLEILDKENNDISKSVNQSEKTKSIDQIVNIDKISDDEATINFEHVKPGDKYTIKFTISIPTISSYSTYLKNNIIMQYNGETRSSNDVVLNFDSDGDNLIGSDDLCTIGNDYEDLDKDGVPDACDDNSEVANKIVVTGNKFNSILIILAAIMFIGFIYAKIKIK